VADHKAEKIITRKWGENRDQISETGNQGLEIRKQRLEIRDWEL
jgi:hypothetical protein